VLQGPDPGLQLQEGLFQGPVLGSKTRILDLEFLNPALQLSGVWFHPLVLKDEHAGEEKDSSEMRVQYRKGGRPVVASRN
jgi:hypothetical protein